MATVGGGAASEREQTALGYLVEQSGADEKEVQAAADANELGRILNGLPEAVKTVYYKMKVTEMKVAKEAAAKARPQLVEEVKACMEDKKLTHQAVADEVRVSRQVISVEGNGGLLKQNGRPVSKIAETRKGICMARSVHL
eukprot:SAG22_NODE_475_length_10003_cov_3.943356_1_plen_141_part_00